MEKEPLAARSGSEWLGMGGIFPRERKIVTRANGCKTLRIQVRLESLRKAGTKEES